MTLCVDGILLVNTQTILSVQNKNKKEGRARFATTFCVVGLPSPSIQQNQRVDISMEKRASWSLKVEDQDI